MTRVITWFIRLCALLILFGLWEVLPHIIPGQGAFIRAVWFLCTVAAFNMSVLALLATLLPSGIRALHKGRKEENESMRKHLDAVLKSHHVHGGKGEGK